ncbi:MAG: PTS glucose transporter subunit IIBC, partial [Clostridia bacterium]
FHATAGFGFSAGLVDFVLSNFNPLQNNIWVLVIMGLVFAAIYYFLFRFLIVKFDMKTPGREDDDEATTVAAE